MKNGPDISHLAALIGEPARANILTALMSGKALTATELAGEAGVTPQTASSHLAKLVQGGLIAPTKQGRHKYFVIANPDIADLLESLIGVAAGLGHIRTRPGPKDKALRKARVCYDHLAGEMGTLLYQRLLSTGMIFEDNRTVSLSQRGAKFFTDFGLTVQGLKTGRATLCRPCLDWSERQFHLGGSLSRAILARICDLGWAVRDKQSRALRFSDRGEASFSHWLSKAHRHNQHSIAFQFSNRPSE